MTNLLAYNVLINANQQWPDRSAVYDEYGQLTFSELFQEAEYLKNELLQRGVGKGMAVGVMARNGRNFITAIFAVVGTGATVMPMSHQLKTAEVEQILKEA